MSSINPADLIQMNQYESAYPLCVELAYARGDNTLFGEAIYRPDAKLWLYKDLADVVLEAAKMTGKRYGHTMMLYDGLRTCDAQALMLKTKVVKENPQWLQEPRLLSPPGAGAHPRGMAIDLSLRMPDGTDLDMGTVFDHLGQSPLPEHNKAHRDHQNLTQAQKGNRTILYDLMMEAAAKCGVDLIGLEQEWWDFRLKPAFYKKYNPLNDKDLPEEKRMALKPDNCVPVFQPHP